MTKTRGSALKERISNGAGRGCASSLARPKRPDKEGSKKAAVLPEPNKKLILLNYSLCYSFFFLLFLFSFSLSLHLIVVKAAASHL